MNNMEQEKKIIEINGVKLEVDLTHTKIQKMSKFVLPISW